MPRDISKLKIINVHVRTLCVNPLCITCYCYIRQVQKSDFWIKLRRNIGISLPSISKSVSQPLSLWSESSSFPILFLLLATEELSVTDPTPDSSPPPPKSFDWSIVRWAVARTGAPPAESLSCLTCSPTVTGRSSLTLWWPSTSSPLWWSRSPFRRACSCCVQEIREYGIHH